MIQANQIFRSKLLGGVVVEFVPPVSASNKVVMICDGLPSVPSKKDVLRHFSEEGFWAVHIRYRGTWESEGQFLAESPDGDLDLVMDALTKTFSDVWTGQEFQIDSPIFHVVGSSFGGTTAIFACAKRRIRRAIALAPVSDWRGQIATEPLPYLKRVIEEGFGPCYRFASADWAKLESGKFFNPVEVPLGFDPKKLVIVHAQDDSVVAIAQSESFCLKHAVRLVKFPMGGHLSVSDISYPSIWSSVGVFLK